MKISTINKCIFDGLEQNLYNLKIDFECLVCDKHILFPMNKIIPLNEINTNILKLLKKMGLKRKSGSHVFENDKGLKIYAIKYTCSKCHSESFVFLGIGEIQPSRFNVIIEGIITI